jgi:hypothetical protein
MVPLPAKTPHEAKKMESLQQGTLPGKTGINFRDWAGVVIPQDTVEGLVRSAVSRLHEDQDQGMTYGMTGDTLVVATRDETGKVTVTVSTIRQVGDLRLPE